MCILSSAKKKPFLTDPKFLTHKGFKVCDEADNGIQLWHLPISKDTEVPKFKECTKHPKIAEKGYVLYYTGQCPFNGKCVPVIEAVAKEHGIAFKDIELQLTVTIDDAIGKRCQFLIAAEYNVVGTKDTKFTSLSNKS